IRLELSHPDFVSDASHAVPVGHTVRHVLQRGVSIGGRVTDADGKPVANALVVWGDTFRFQRERHEVPTSPDGMYRLPPLPAGTTGIAVVAEGRAPESRIVTIAAETRSVDFQLHPGRRMRIRFVDRNGEPVPGVGVFIERWRGTHLLYGYQLSQSTHLNI